MYIAPSVSDRMLLPAEIVYCYQVTFWLLWGMAASAPPPVFFCLLLLRSIIVSVAPPVILGEEEIFPSVLPSLPFGVCGAFDEWPN